MSTATAVSTPGRWAAVPIAGLVLALAPISAALSLAEPGGAADGPGVGYLGPPNPLPFLGAAVLAIVAGAVLVYRLRRLGRRAVALLSAALLTYAFVSLDARRQLLVASWKAQCRLGSEGACAAARSADGR